MNICDFSPRLLRKTTVLFQLSGERGFNHILVETSDNTKSLQFPGNKKGGICEKLANPASKTECW
jgi:hypothetical protein